MSIAIKKTILPKLQETIEKLTSEFTRIPNDRLSTITKLADFIKQRAGLREKALLNFICTHNSRRSHIAQIWAQTAAYYYDINIVETYSGGTEATAFNPRAVTAMKQAGFDIEQKENGPNPVYEVRFSGDASPMTVFSKTYDDFFNPKNNFAAIMTCSHADQNCPLIIGATVRIALTYDDPKEFDGTSKESGKYFERVQEIGREILFAFSLVK